MRNHFLLIFLCVIFCFTVLHAEEGMWPMSEIHNIDLASKGFKLKPVEIYNPEGISLIDGICKVGGCTGSFVSNNGLILTNHHCAYRAIQSASTKEHDYIKNGFLANNQVEEIPAKGYTVRITESYRDVSDEVLSVVNDDMELAKRTKAIEKKRKEIIKRTEKEHPGKRAEISEMFIGKTYVLFLYTYLKDIRLVYAPPRSIGEFGGETDNWMWPRHSGDFSFMRAYVAKDGSPADYSKENVPYQPKNYLKIQPKGVDEEDFVFIFGYPGKTYRHRTSLFLSYEEQIRMPYVVDWYQWQIDLMEGMGQDDRSVVLKHLSRIKGLSNTMKNYRGKLLGLKRLHLVNKKKIEEQKMIEFIIADENRKKKFGNLFSELDEIYQDLQRKADYELTLYYFKRSVYLLRFAYTVYEAAVERQKEDVDREFSYMDRNFDRTRKRIELAAKDYYEPTDKIIFKELLMRAAKLPTELRIPVIDKIIKDDNASKSFDKFIECVYRDSKLNDVNLIKDLFKKSPKDIEKIDDSFIKLAIELYPIYQKQKEIKKTRKGAIDKLYSKLIDLKKEFSKENFIPDANGTLRLTFGHIRGYTPADATYYSPISTVAGVLEKSTNEEPFDSPKKLINLIRTKNYGQFEHSKLNSVPTCILYDMDTTGGNSGSPVMNASGEIVGLNFDRAYEATINDYAWSQDYSRSIGVDIRYILWVLQKFGEVDYLLQEMGIEK